MTTTIVDKVCLVSVEAAAAAVLVVDNSVWSVLN